MGANGRKRKNNRREKKAGLSQSVSVKQSHHNNSKHSANNSQSKKNKTNAVPMAGSIQYSAFSQNENRLAPDDVHDEASDSSESSDANTNAMKSTYVVPSHTIYQQYRRYNHGQCGLNNLGNTCFIGISYPT
jgi:hypothetical protein